jgi:hypothetical protein
MRKTERASGPSGARAVPGLPDSGTATLHLQLAGSEHEEDVVIGLGR